MRRSVIMVHSESSWGGNLNIVLAISNKLMKSSYRVYLLHPEGEEYAEKFAEAGIDTVSYRYRGRLDHYGIYEITLKLRKLKENTRFVLHSHNRRADLICAILGCALQVPTLTTQHGEINLNSETLEPERTIPAQMYRLMLRLLFNRIICVSETSSRDVREEILHPPHWKMKTIRNGVNTDLIRRNRDEEWIERKRREFDIPSDAIVISHLASIHKKGHQTFIPAVSEVIRRFDREIFFLIAGEGPKFDEVREFIERQEVGDRIQLLGYRDDPIEILNISDIYIHPSLSEGLSISILEAMAMELPVIATPVGGTPDIVIPYKTGLLIPVGGKDELFRAICELVNDEDLRTSLGKRAREFVERGFTESAMVEEYIKTYEEIFK